MAQQLTDEIIQAAIEGYESQKARIDTKIAELQALRSGRPAGRTAAQTVPGKRRKFSAEAIQRMREAQRKRWERVHSEAAPAKAVEAPAKPKRKLSPAARAKLAANLAKARAAKAARAKSAGKKTAKKAGPRKTAAKQTATATAVS